MTGLPVISLARAEQGDEAKVADEISRACTETGFFVVRDHGIDREVFDTTYELSFGVGRLVLDETEQLPFPADKRGIALRDALKTYVAACRSVADRVTELLTMAPDPPDAVAAARTDRSDDSLRCPYHLGEREEPLGDRGTGDDTLITLLTEDGPGLQLRDLSGNWIDVDVPGRDWFIVGVGGLSARWSNDAYVSTPRRVGLGDRPRQSIAFFKLANDDAVVESFPEPTRERPATYVPIRDEQFSSQKMDALFGREEVRL
ncbi:isopenicillin N synthase family oxygenase [Streptomyces purpureus]|uniref:2OG-Fe(II) oxygenase n=1 Tax=Streptomyces purpureus TaxID=1951 RepID=A0A918GXT4_9ACTN|nr:isopenicillin N synthase family oxygenase [Streptomyces purpureus]GGT19525.1 2OG-Fe(II) oxygenase [Streptomyces purpureus]